LLAEHRRSEAIRELWASWRTRPTVAASKTLVRALVASGRA
jgi:hypothetical protein